MWNPIDSAKEAMMNEFVRETLGLAVRHGLTTLAGVLLSYGYIMDSQAAQIAAAAPALAGILWSLYQKYQTLAVTKAALSMQAGATLPEAKIVAKSLSRATVMS